VPGGKVKVPKIGEVNVAVPGSAASPGDWNDFTAAGFLGAGDFEGVPMYDASAQPAPFVPQHRVRGM
jgi:hypothetical protein